MMMIKRLSNTQGSRQHAVVGLECIHCIKENTNFRANIYFRVKWWKYKMSQNMSLWAFIVLSSPTSSHLGPSHQLYVPVMSEIISQKTELDPPCLNKQGYPLLSAALKCPREGICNWIRISQQINVFFRLICDKIQLHYKNYICRSSATGDIVPADWWHCTGGQEHDNSSIKTLSLQINSYSSNLVQF